MKSHAIIAALGAWLVAAAPAAAVSVVVFDDAAWVNTTGSFGQESLNVQASLVSLGYGVSTFTGLSGADWQSAAASADVILLPEQSEQGFDPTLAESLDPAAVAAIRSFVADGGGFIIHSHPDFFRNDVNFLNEIFDFSIAAVASPNSAQDLVAGAAGTAFEGGPLTIADLSAIGFIGALPAGATPIYQEAFDQVSVAILPFGDGEIVYLGWDWFDAAPLGSSDGGWLEVLDLSIQQVGGSHASSVPAPAALPLLLSALGMAALLRGRRRPL